MRHLAGSLALLLTASACGSPLDLAPPSARAAPTVRVEPLGELERAPGVLRLRVQGAFGRSNLADFRLFRGELSPYHLGRIRQRDVPKTLLEREVTVAAWGEGSDVVVAPSEVLATGAVTLATPELGPLAVVSVDAELVPWLERRWPPADQRLGSGLAIFCGPGAAGVGETAVLLDPGGVGAMVRQGLGGRLPLEQDCVRVEPTTEPPEGTLLFPPLLVGGTALEPLPLVVAAAAAPAVRCDAGELPFGPTCASVADDRARLRAPSGASFWLLREPGERLATVAPGQSLVLGGLEPGRPGRLSGTFFDLGGATATVELEVVAREAAPHVVINEVLANPVGLERASEWIELVNDGRQRVDVGGFALRDAAGTSTLPALGLDPGEMVLLVAEGFEPDPELDLVPPARVRRLVVPALGSGSLSNGGEPLRLLDREGLVISRFPAFAAGKAGQSFARVAPEAPDDEPASFARHAGPGASPGEPNVVMAEP